MSAVRVLLVLYDESTRRTLRSILSEESNIEAVGEATGVAEALVQVDDISPDVVLTDADMPDVTGVELMRLLKDNGYGGPTVMLGSNLDSLDEALRAGELGYATNEVLGEELADIIGRATEGSLGSTAASWERRRG